MKIVTIILYGLIIVTLPIKAEERYKEVDGVPEDVKSITSSTPIYSQKVNHSLPVGWTPVYENATRSQYIIEFVPKGQTVEKWNDMLTIIGFRGAAPSAEPIDAIRGTSQNIKKACPNDMVFEEIGETIIDGYRSYEAIVGCAKMPEKHLSGISKGQGEISYYLAIEGENDIYFIQKARRLKAFSKSSPPLTQKNYKEFIFPIFPIQLCKKTGKPYECNK